MDASAVVVRRVRADEWQAWRELRLAALATDPSAFGSTYEREAAYDEAEWRSRVSAAAEGDRVCSLVAERADGIVGLIGGWWPPEFDEPEVVSMWVRPEARGGGVAAALVEGIVDWAADAGADGVWLFVTRGNDPAEKLYRRFGFDDWPDDSGQSIHPCSGERRMRLELS